MPLVDSFFGGPSLVRGFAPNGFGPRDLTPGTTMDNVGGSLYWATSAELQSPIPGVPGEYGLKASAFVDAGSVFRYAGPTTFPGSTQSLQLANGNIVRSSVGVGLTWASPFGGLDGELRRAGDQGELRRGAATRLQRQPVLRAGNAVPKIQPGHAMAVFGSAARYVGSTTFADISGLYCTSIGAKHDG